jgi:uncharacterized membrane protein YdbT with pleckstrin-like domain
MLLIVCNAGLLALWFAKEKLRPGRWLVVPGTLLAAYLLLLVAGALTGALTDGSPRPPAPFLLQWFFAAAIWSIPLIITTRAKMCALRDGWLRITDGVFRRTTTPIPLYRILALTASQSGLGRLFGVADLAIQFSDETGKAATASVRGVGRLEEVQKIADQATGIANDLRAGAWRAGASLLTRPDTSRPPVHSGDSKRSPHPRPDNRPNPSRQQRGSV